MGIILTGADLTLEELRRVAYDHETVELSDDARRKVQASRQVIENILAGDRVVYGINTGFGNFRDVIIPRKDLDQLQINLLRSHAAGVGDPLPEPVVRSVMLLRANTLAAGFSGVHPDTLDCLLKYLNARVHPILPEKGSVGASGDLAPHRLVRESVDFYEVDRTHQPDIEAVDNLLWDGKVFETAAQALEGLE